MITEAILINKPLAMCKELPTSKAAAALLHRVLATQSPKRFRYQQPVIVTMASHWLREAVLHLLQTILLTALVFLLSPSSSAGEFTTSNRTAVPVACLPERIFHHLQLLHLRLPFVEGRHGLLPLGGRPVRRLRRPRDFPRPG